MWYNVKMDTSQYRHSRERSLSPGMKIALGLLTVGSLFALHEMSEDQEKRETQMEDCVGEVVGRDVNLETNPETGILYRPASVFEEVVACQQADADAIEAKILLDD